MIKLKVIIYLRLSKEDGDTESQSISNQRKILYEYARTHNMEIVDEYVDDGVSGYTMNRPDFNRLKQDLNDGIVNVILVKDLSRLGRHNAKVQLFIENIVEDDKRVISLGENFDSTIPSCLATLGIHTWSNEQLIRDTSRKVRDSIKSLQKEGKWLCGIPYGYVKDDFDKYKYYVDETTAPYVRMMFEMYINGDGVNMLARKLNDMKVPSPSIVKKMRFEAKGKQYKLPVNPLWDPTAVRRIITNDFYTGTLTLGKTKARSINGRQIAQPKENRYIFINAHEPIIDEQTFNITQQLLRDRSTHKYRGASKRVDSIFSRMLECADCGKRLVMRGIGIQNESKYVCGTYNTYGSKQCSAHAINEYELKIVLFEFLEHCRDNLSDIIEDVDKIINAEIQSRGKSNDAILTLTKQLEAVKASVSVLIEQKMRETMKNPSMVDIIDKTYDETINDRYKELQILEKQIEDQKNFAQQEIELKKNLNSALSIINEIIMTKSITRKQLLLLVDRIVVYEDSGIDIYLNGNLHEITNNYFKIGMRKYDQMKALICDFILQSPEKFALTDAIVYLKENGIGVSHRTVSKLFKDELLSSNMIKLRKSNRGYELLATEEELICKLKTNIVYDRSRWLRHNNETFKLLIEINNWIKEISDTTKYLF